MILFINEIINLFNKNNIEFITMISYSHKKYNRKYNRKSFRHEYRYGRKSHNETISLRKLKKNKKQSHKDKKYHLKEFLKHIQSEKKNESDKTISISLMNIVEDINENGMNDKKYMDMMNILMKLHNKEDNKSQFSNSIPRSGQNWTTRIDNYYYNIITNNQIQQEVVQTYHRPGGITIPETRNIIIENNNNFIYNEEGEADDVN